MRKILISFLFAILVLTLFAEAEITFDNLSFDYGDIKEDEGHYEHNFVFTNTGDQSFALEKVKAGWGCTTPSWSTEEIKPGEKGFVKVAYKSENRPGKFGKNITVSTSINNAVIRLKVKGNVIPTPGKLRFKIGILKCSLNKIDFGNIFYKKKAIHIIELANDQKSEIIVDKIETPKHIKLDMKSNVIAPGERSEIKITFNTRKSKDFGKSTTSIPVSMKFKDQIYNGSIKITAKIVEDFSKLSIKELANAPVIHFPITAINIDEIIAKQYKIVELEFENRGKDELIIRDADVINKAYSVSEFDDRVEAGSTGRIKLRIKAADGSSNLNAKVRITSNDPVNFETTVKLISAFKPKAKPKPESKLNTKKAIDIKVKQIEVVDAYNLLRNRKKLDDIIVIDVRTPKEFKKDSLPGALNIDILDVNFYGTIKLIDKTKLYLVYSNSGERSQEAIVAMHEHGFERLYHMFKGMSAWIANNFEELDVNKKK